MKNQFYPALEAYVAEIIAQASQVPAERQALLLKLSDYLRRNAEKTVQLNFICTHNSRRSHLGQVWTAVAAAHYGLENIRCYSGGTEATAFNPRAVAALERAGFVIDNPGGENPRYAVHFSEDAAPVISWSKTFDDPANPTEDFAAIMTCSDADENCPYIPGAAFRLPLTYDDPKEADDTPEEAARYDERVQQIGREIFFAVKNSLGELAE
ncbi:protein-tyrosine-phosphatase [Neolewinella lacunae]|uniref:Protein-tyrosine-phosphatase n=1 Tax=Neolewinella lacunae TaxID=1517758 RepID=A0A923TAS8_9BACT|nr:protein-tyrosine-phosphatase [Neolewinella lacunae]MBC6996806.1 protein-tyrosine-phosphatase [Neolewinella lacunae]MDN3637034.1 protein-tyrosine-phosphatase [Neolewinella lacunae]